MTQASPTPNQDGPAGSPDSPAEVPSPDSPADVPVAPGQGVVLPPHYGVAGGLSLLALAVLGVASGPGRQAAWGPATLGLGALLLLFGLFLLLQTALLRLEFCDDGLLVWRRSTLLRRFPYDSWLGWRLFWPALPVLFYFREQRSPHLLPVLFGSTELQQQLRRHLAQLPPPERKQDSA